MVLTMFGKPLARDCASCVVDTAMDCRNCLAEQLLHAQAQGDHDEVVRLEYLIALFEGVMTVVTSIASTH